MLQDENILFEEGELVPSSDIPTIIIGYIKWFRQNAIAAGLGADYLFDEFERLTENHSSFETHGPLARLLEDNLTDINLILEEHNIERVAQEQQNTLKELFELSQLAAGMIASIKHSFDTFNKQITEEGGELYQINTPVLRICQLPDCNNELDTRQHHSAKYCLKCQTNGNLKKFYNKKHSAKVKQLTGEIND